VFDELDIVVASVEVLVSEGVDLRHAPLGIDEEVSADSGVVTVWRLLAATTL
jgi:hypothetical protein